MVKLQDELLDKIMNKCDIGSAIGIKGYLIGSNSENIYNGITIEAYKVMTI